MPCLIAAVMRFCASIVSSRNDAAWSRLHHAVARQDLRVRARHVEIILRAPRSCPSRAAVAAVDARIADRAEHVADVDHVGLREADVRVAVGMRRRKLADLDVLAVEVQLAPCRCR